MDFMQSSTTVSLKGLTSEHWNRTRFLPCRGSRAFFIYSRENAGSACRIKKFYDIMGLIAEKSTDGRLSSDNGPLSVGKEENSQMKATIGCPMKQLQCGGCPLLDVPYPEQLRRKQKTIESLFGRFCRPEPIIGMETPFHYRNKAIATFSSARGKLACGIYAAHTHRVVSVKDCLLQDSRINEIIGAALSSATKCHLPAYDEDRGTGLLRHMVVRRGISTGEISVTVVTPSEYFPASRNFVRSLLEKCPDVTTVVQNTNPRHTSAVLGTEEKVLFGSGFIRDRLCGNTFCISPRAFYQVNPSQTERLYQTALEFAGLTGKEQVIDAYCGIGTISLAAAKYAGDVLGMEINNDAVHNARWNARLNDCKNVNFVRGDAGKLMTEMAKEGEKADLVFLDPPREGASRQFLVSLLRLAPSRIVYISCEPSTLARDAAFLVKGGYEIRRVRPVDMFPHTQHIETVCLLVRRRKRQDGKL